MTVVTNAAVAIVGIDLNRVAVYVNESFVM